MNVGAQSHLARKQDLKQAWLCRVAANTSLSGPQGVLESGVLGARWQEAQAPGSVSHRQLRACLPCPDLTDLGLGRGRGLSCSSGARGRLQGRQTWRLGWGRRATLGRRLSLAAAPAPSSVPPALHFCPSTHPPQSLVLPPPRLSRCPYPNPCQAPPGSKHFLSPR